MFWLETPNILKEFHLIMVLLLRNGYFDKLSFHANDWKRDIG